MLSTIHMGSETVSKTRRQNNGARASEQLLKTQTDSNAYMGGVDKADMMISYYSSDRKCISHWYLHYFHWIIEVACHNAFCIWQSSITKGRGTRYTALAIDVD